MTTYSGNLTDRGSDEFEWDYEDRMVSATVDSAETAFAYRGDGLRESRTFNSNTVTFTWDIAAGLPVVIDDEDARYVYGAGLVSQVTSDESYYYLSDGLGSTVVTVDSGGDVVNSYTYDVFGQTRSESGAQANEFRFAGQQVDGSTGLQYLRARYLDMETGRFISRDPMARGPAWGDNPYTYAGSNPARHSDPLGLCWGPDWRCKAQDKATNAVGDTVDFLKNIGASAASNAFEGLLDTIDVLTDLAKSATGVALDAINSVLDMIADIANLVREKAQKIWSACTDTFAQVVGCAFEFAEAVAVVAVGAATATALIAACVLAPPACVVAIPAAMIVLAGVGFALYGFYRVITAEHESHGEEQPTETPPVVPHSIRGVAAYPISPNRGRGWNLGQLTM